MIMIYLFIYLRLTFGWSSSLAEWCIIIEISADLANNITNNPFCSHTTIFTKQHEPSQLSTSIVNPSFKEFTQTLPADVYLHLPHHG